MQSPRLGLVLALKLSAASLQSLWGGGLVAGPQQTNAKVLPFRRIFQFGGPRSLSLLCFEEAIFCPHQTHLFASFTKDCHPAAPFPTFQLPK